MRRFWIVLVAVIPTLLLSAPTAHANLRMGGVFVFAPLIREGDPVNLLFDGGTDMGQPTSACGYPNDKSVGCAESHVITTWQRGSMREHFCNFAPQSDLRFRLPPGGTAHSGEDKATSTSNTCKNQFHLRLWSDSHAGDPTPAWDVGAAHHEQRCAVLGACKHHIDMDWEAVEWVTFRQMNRNYCAYYGEYPFPGTAGKIHGHYSDGYLTRVSFSPRSSGCHHA